MWFDFVCPAKRIGIEKTLLQCIQGYFRGFCIAFSCISRLLIFLGLPLFLNSMANLISVLFSSFPKDSFFMLSLCSFNFFNFPRHILLCAMISSSSRYMKRQFSQFFKLWKLNKASFFGWNLWACRNTLYSDGNNLLQTRHIGLLKTLVFFCSFDSNNPSAYSLLNWSVVTPCFLCECRRSEHLAPYILPHKMHLNFFSNSSKKLSPFSSPILLDVISFDVRLPSPLLASWQAVVSHTNATSRASWDDILWTLIRCSNNPFGLLKNVIQDGHLIVPSMSGNDSTYLWRFLIWELNNHKPFLGFEAGHNGHL